MPEVKIVKRNKCHCCGNSIGPTLFETKGRLFYNSAFGVVEYDPKADFGLRLWELVDDEGVFWEEWPLEHNIRQSWISCTMGLKGEISEDVLQKTIENLHVPFMS